MLPRPPAADDRPTVTGDPVPGTATRPLLGRIPSGATQGYRSAARATVLALGLGAVLVSALALGGALPAAALPGLPDPGPLTGWGVPVLRLLTRLTALGTVGTLLLAALLTPATDPGFDRAARAAVRAAFWWALAWAAAGLSGGLLTMSAVYGVPVGALTPTAVLAFATDVAPGRAAAGVVVLASVVGVAARRCRRSVTAAGLLALAGSAVLLPTVLAGHSAAAGDHWLATGALSVHVVSATCWVGGLAALVVHGRGPGLATAAGRFSTLALICFAAAGASGIVGAWVLSGGSTDALAATLGTGYGVLLLLKTSALVVLGAVGWWHRRATLPLLRAARPGAFRRFAAVEAVVMLATVTLAVALSASPPPAPAPVPASPSATASQPSGAAGTAPGERDPSQDMSGHDHGELSVAVLVDATRFHVSSPVAPGQSVTVYNESTTDVTITADDGSFDVLVRGQTFVTFTAPSSLGDHRFSSRHSPRFADVLVVR